MYFKVTIAYKSPMYEDTGNEAVETNDQIYKKNKDSFLVNADSVTYAEAKILKELPDNYMDKNVKGVIASNVNRVIFSSGEEWFLFGIKYIEINDSGKEKSTHEYVMINGDDIDDAIKNMRTNNEDTVLHYRIVSVQESKILVDRDLLTSDTVIEKSDDSEN